MLWVITSWWQVEGSRQGKADPNRQSTRTYLLHISYSLSRKQPNAHNWWKTRKPPSHRALTRRYVTNWQPVASSVYSCSGDGGCGGREAGWYRLDSGIWHNSTGRRQLITAYTSAVVELSWMMTPARRCTTNFLADGPAYSVASVCPLSPLSSSVTLCIVAKPNGAS